MIRFLQRLLSITFGLFEYILPNIKSLQYKSPVYLIVFINLIPIFGILFLGWQAWFIIFAYWAENVVLWFYHIFKFLLWGMYQVYLESKEKGAIGLFMIFPILFFTFFISVIFGAFILALGVFVVYVCLIGLSLNIGAYTTQNMGNAAGNPDYSQMLDNFNNVQGLDGIIAYIGDFMGVFFPSGNATLFEIMDSEFFYIVLLFLSHSYAFIRYFLLGAKFKKGGDMTSLKEPYIRFFIILFVIILFFSVLFIMNTWFEFSITVYKIIVVVLLLIKMLLDITGHRREYGTEKH